MNIEEGYRELQAGLGALDYGNAFLVLCAGPDCRSNLRHLAIRFDLQQVVHSCDTRHLLRFGFDSGFLLAALDGAS